MTAADAEGVPVFFEEVAFVEEPEIIGIVEL
jgi:hypothetical protein